MHNSRCLRLLSLLLLALGLTQVQADAGKPQPTLPTAVLEINNHRLVTEIAISPLERQRGLSFRESLDKDGAMLFVYNEERRRLFLSLIHI